MGTLEYERPSGAAFSNGTTSYSGSDRSPTRTITFFPDESPVLRLGEHTPYSASRKLAAFETLDLDFSKRRYHDVSAGVVDWSPSTKGKGRVDATPRMAKESAVCTGSDEDDPMHALW